MELDSAADAAIAPDIGWTCPDIEGSVQFEPKALDWTSHILRMGVHVRRGLRFSLLAYFFLGTLCELTNNRQFRCSNNHRLIG
jgi:hypothetical protein